MSSFRHPSNTRHTQYRSNRRHAPGHKVHQPQPRKCNSQPRELLKPRVEIRRRHEEHPPHQPGDAQCELNASRRRIALNLYPLLLHRHTRRLAVCQRNQPSIAQTLDPRERREKLKPEQRTPKNQQKDVSRNIVSTLPRTADRITRRGRNELPRIAHIRPLRRIAQPLALPAREPKHRINQRRAKEPLRNRDPPARDDHISGDGSDAPPTYARAETRVEADEDAECERRPEPPDLDEVDVEDVLLVREVRGREFGGVGLRVGGVGRAAGGRREGAENAAEEEGEGVDGD